jgi:hypothetical protein
VKKVCYIAAHTAVVYDCHTHTQMVLQGHCNPITCLVATADRSVVATADAGPDSMIVLWNVATVGGRSVSTCMQLTLRLKGAWFQTLGADQQPIK